MMKASKKVLLTLFWKSQSGEIQHSAWRLNEQRGEVPDSCEANTEAKWFTGSEDPSPQSPDLGRRPRSVDLG